MDSFVIIENFGENFFFFNFLKIVNNRNKLLVQVNGRVSLVGQPIAIVLSKFFLLFSLIPFFSVTSSTSLILWAFLGIKCFNSSLIEKMFSIVVSLNQVQCGIFKSGSA